MNERTVVDTFEIPEELAKELSEILAKEAVKTRLLAEIIDAPSKADIVEKSLVELHTARSILMNKITTEHIPEKYRSAKYSWNYDGFAVAKTTVQIILT